MRVEHEGGIIRVTMVFRGHLPDQRAEHTAVGRHMYDGSIEWLDDRTGGAWVPTRKETRRVQEIMVRQHGFVAL